ncbi:MAG: hypothetical protein ABW133_11650 [Polyangiaceae bacterium]
MSIAKTFAALFVVLLLVKCDQGYPIAPTLCDELCAAEHRLPCDGDLDPASCVAQCEADRQSDPGVLQAGSPARCDRARTDLLACVRTLPDVAFSCTGGIKERGAGPCLEAAQFHLAICRARKTTTWEDLCSSWARRCTDQFGTLDGGDSWGVKYRSCLEPYRYARGCPGEQNAFVECLLGRELSCDRIPTLDEGCQAERMAIDTCDPRRMGACLLWATECTTRAKDAGSDATTSNPADPSPYSATACMMDRPLDVRPRCLREREALYDCFSVSWYESHILRCDVTPVHATECAWERMKLEACAMSSDAGAN